MRVRRILAGLIIVASLAWPLPASTAGTSAAGAAWHRDVVAWARDKSMSVATSERGLSAVATHLRMTGHGEARFLVAVYGGAGVRRWARTWQPLTDSMTIGAAVDVAADGRVIAGGEVLRPFRFPESPGWFVRVYGPAGRLMWERAAPGWRYGRASSGTSGVASFRGHVLVSGWTCGESGCYGGWVRSFASGGAARWTGEVGGRYGATSDVATTPFGEVYVGGSHDVTDPMDGHAKAYVTAFTSTGHRRWTRVLTSLGSTAETEAVAVRDDLVVAGGRARGYHVAEPWGLRPFAWLAALDAEGTVRWMHTWGRDRTLAQQVEDVAIGPTGWVRAVGSTRRPDGSISLFIRTYRPTGELAGVRLIDPSRVDAYGLAVDVDPLGMSVVGGLDAAGRLWRFPS